MKMLLASVVLAATLASPSTAATFVVNSAGSQSDGCDEVSNSDPAVCDTGSCASPTGLCTLHAAIRTANENPGLDQITFSVAAITCTADFDLILDPVSIDGSGGSPRVDLNGNNNASGLRFDSDAAGSTVTNMVIRNMSNNGIDITTGTGNTLIENNYIGTNAAGSAASANRGDGISISSPGGPIPPIGTTTIHGNVISGNEGDGIDIFGPNTTGVLVTGNFIGTDVNGLAAVPNSNGNNQNHGIRISSDAFGIVIGGPSPALANVIAGNDDNIFSEGIAISGEVDLPNIVLGNFIGLTPALILDLGNGGAGIHATGVTPSPENPTGVALLIGPGNVVGYNGSNTDPADGILITGDSSGTYVFTNAVGVAELGGSFIDLGNSGNGIVVTGPGNFVGVDDLGVVGGNFVGANGGNGIELRGPSATNNVVVGNFVGDPDPGDVFGMGNDGNGVLINGAPRNRIGGPADDESNTIRGNGGNGIRVEGSGAIGNLLTRNSIDENGLLGIDLDFISTPGEVDPIDPSDPNNSANRGLNAPTLLVASYDGGSGATTIDWQLETIPSTEGFIIEFYSSPTADPSGAGEGRTYLGEVTGISTDALGFASGTAPVSPSTPTNTAGQGISAITRATWDDSGVPADDTSEFSSVVVIEAFSIADVSAPEGNAGTSSMQFAVTRTSSAGAASVDVSSAAGTATSGVDYQDVAPQTVNFADGVDTVLVDVTVFGDTMREPNETFTVTLANPSSGWSIQQGEAHGTIVNDDPIPTASIGDVSALEGNAGTTNFDFVITLSNPSSIDSNMSIFTASGTAIFPADFAFSSAPVVIPAGATSAVATIAVVGDTDIETDETFFVDLIVGNVNVGDGRGVGTIQNDDGISELSINDVAQAEGNGGTTAFTFTVSRTTTDDAASVQVVSSDGTAAAPGDYTALGLTTVSFAIGEATRQVTINVLGDTTFESNETFLVTLSNPSAGYTIGDGSGQGTIQNDDPEPSLSIGDVAQLEGNAGTTTFSFAVTLSNPSSLDVGAAFQSADGSAAAPGDYTATSGSLSIPAGQLGTTVSVSVVGDVAMEGDETFTVTLSAPTNAGISDGEGLGTITNDDGVRLFSIDDVSQAEGNVGTTAFTFTITRTTTDDAASVTVTSADGSATAPADYAAIAGQVVNFAIGEATRPVNVAVGGETLYEGGETFQLQLSAPSSGYAIADGTGIGTITNDDQPPVLSVTSLGAAEGSGGGSTNFDFVVDLDAPSGLAVSASWATTDGSAVSPTDFAAVVGGSLNIPAGSTTTTATVVVVADDIPEPTESFTVTLSSPVGASIGTGTAVGTIEDDDSGPTFSIADVTALEGSGGGTTSFSFTVTRSSSSGAASVEMSTSDGSATAPGDFATVAGLVVSFADGETSLPVVVQVVADTTFEGTETFTATLSNPSPGYDLADPVGVGTIQNDDGQPTISVDDVAATEGNAGTTTFSFLVSLSNPSSLGITVNYQTTDGTATAPGDFTATAGTASIAAGGLSAAIEVAVAGDLTIESDENFTLDLTNASGATIADASGLGTILDDDGGPTAVIDDVTAASALSGTTLFTFTVSLSNPSAFPASVEWTTADGTATSPEDYLADSGTLSIAPGELSGQIEVEVVGDGDLEGDETFTVELSNAVGLSIGDGQGLGTILDAAGAPNALEIPTLAEASLLVLALALALLGIRRMRREAH